MKLVLFDCDGTLVDSAALIHATMARMFADHGIADPGLAAVRSVIGRSLDLAIGDLLDRAVDAEVLGMASAYKALYPAMRADPALRETAFAGRAGLVAALSRDAAVLVGVVTGKSRRGLASILQSLELSHAVAVLRTADDCPSKPHPAMVLECCEVTGVAPSDALVIGDATFDIEMAKHAGAAAIGVGWGYHDRLSLLQAGARGVARDAGELAAMINDWRQP